MDVVLQELHNFRYLSSRYSVAFLNIPMYSVVYLGLFPWEDVLSYVAPK